MSVSRSYARALLEAATESGLKAGDLDVIEGELNAFSSAMGASAASPGAPSAAPASDAWSPASTSVTAAGFDRSGAPLAMSRRLTAVIASAPTSPIASAARVRGGRPGAGGFGAGLGSGRSLGAS